MNETLTMKERMLLGLPYKANDEHLTREYIQCAKRLKSYNNFFHISPHEFLGFDLPSLDGRIMCRNG